MPWTTADRQSNLIIAGIILCEINKNKCYSLSEDETAGVPITLVSGYLTFALELSLNTEITW